VGRSLPYRNALLIGALMSAAAIPAFAEGTTALIYGDGFSYQVTSPAGWVLDTESGAADGLKPVFYPTGRTWANAPAVIYVHSIEREHDAKLDAVIASETDNFRHVAGGHPMVRVAPAVELESGAQVPIRLFSGDRFGNHEAVAYLDGPNVVGLVVLAAHQQADFNAALPAFRALVKSWRLVKSEATEAVAP
jgi:hypothetical protein